MRNHNIAIENSNGERLHAVLELPSDKKARQFAVFAHCFTCSSNLNAVLHVSRELTRYGFGVLRFDFTGLGQSEGEFSDTNFSHNLEDLRIVNNYLTQHYEAPTLLVGHSLGGAAVLMAAGQLENVKAVATIGAPADPEHVRHLFDHHIDDLLSKGQAEIRIGGRKFMMKKQFLDDLQMHSLKGTLQNMRKPLLILHSPQDTIVDISNAAQIYQSARHPKSFVSLDGADHLLSEKKDSRYAARIIGTWVERYLMSTQNEGHALETRGEQVVAHWHHQGHFVTQISNQRQTITADEPTEAGGEDQGFSPYELLTAALGACTAMTLKLYAERKKWPLEEVYVYLSHQRKHRDDCGEGNGACGKIDLITKTLECVGDLTGDQIRRLQEIASRCPVHLTLTSPTEINTRLETL